MYEFAVTGVWEIGLAFRQFGVGLEVETTIVLSVDGMSWSHDKYEGDTTLAARTLWDERSAEFGVKGGDGGHNTHLIDDESFIRWVTDIVKNVKPARFEVLEERSMSRSEW